jgi:hypothetical protein
MLEAFVNKLKGRVPHHWVDAQESLDNMHWLERIYEKVTGQLSRFKHVILTNSNRVACLPDQIPHMFPPRPFERRQGGVTGLILGLDLYVKGMSDKFTGSNTYLHVTAYARDI